MKKFVITLLKIIGFFVIWIVLLQLSKAEIFKPPVVFATDAPLSEAWNQGLSMVTMIIVTVIFVWLIDWGKTVPRLTSNGFRDTFFGIIIGLIWIVGTIGLLMLTSSIEFQRWQNIPGFWIWIVAILFNTITIEYMFRGYIFTLLEKNYGAIAAISIPALIYLAVHGQAITNGIISILFVLTASILLSLMRYHTKGILAPLMAHFVWNIVGGLIVGGVPIGVQYPNMLEKNLSGLALVTGGDAKFEGSALTLIVLINLIYLVVLMMRDASDPRKAKAKRNRKHT